MARPNYTLMIVYGLLLLLLGSAAATSGGKPHDGGGKQQQHDGATATAASGSSKAAVHKRKGELLGITLTMKEDYTRGCPTGAEELAQLRSFVARTFTNLLDAAGCGTRARVKIGDVECAVKFSHHDASGSSRTVIRYVVKATMSAPASKKEGSSSAASALHALVDELLAAQRQGACVCDAEGVACADVLVDRFAVRRLAKKPIGARHYAFRLQGKHAELFRSEPALSSSAGGHGGSSGSIRGSTGDGSSTSHGAGRTNNGQQQQWSDAGAGEDEDEEEEGWDNGDEADFDDSSLDDGSAYGGGGGAGGARSYKKSAGGAARVAVEPQQGPSLAKASQQARASVAARRSGLHAS